MGQVTISGNVFEIYGTRAAADIYMSARLGAEAWDDASTIDKDKALVSAARFFDRQNWQGKKEADVQPLEFPRTGLVDKDGDPVDSTKVPIEMEEGGYELGLSLLDDPTVQENVNTGSNTKRVKASTVEVEFFTITEGLKFPDLIHELVSLWLESTVATTGPRAFGTDVCSGLPGPFDVNKGLA